MTRRFASFGVEDLEIHAENHPADVPEIIEELRKYRTTRVARHLLDRLKSQPLPFDIRPSEQTPNKTGNIPQNKGTKRSRPSNWSKLFDYAATEEQEKAVDLFLTKKSMKVSAFAGAGKTSTLKFLAATAPRDRGLYLAFNKSIAAEARQSFSSKVDCRTTHSAALRDVRPRHSFNRDKLFNSMNTRQLAAEWGIERYQAGPMTLKPDMIAFLIQRTVRKFCQSGDQEVVGDHVELIGRSLGLAPDRKEELKSHVLQKARRLWSEMTDSASDIPLGHDGYLKLWSLLEPKFACDFVLLDEAQDTNPAVLSVLRAQDCQVIFVGDKHQQIYEWRGAVNAMEEIDAENEAHLTTSFRFGPALANEANRVLRALGETQTLKGFNQIDTEICSYGTAKAVLTRTNAMLFSEVLEALEEQKTTHVVGGTEQMKALLRDVDALQAGNPGAQPEFFGFANWQEMLEFVEEPEGESLKAFVTLVERVGRGSLWRAVLSCEDEEGAADIVLSTAHKSKGREWDSVRLAEDFSSSQSDTGRIPFSEARLFYVAMTRARRKLVVDPVLVSAFSSNLAPDAEIEAMSAEVNGAKNSDSASKPAVLASKRSSPSQNLRQENRPPETEHTVEPSVPVEPTRPIKKKKFFGFIG